MDLKHLDVSLPCVWFWAPVAYRWHRGSLREGKTPPQVFEVSWQVEMKGKEEKITRRLRFGRFWREFLEVVIGFFLRRELLACHPFQLVRIRLIHFSNQPKCVNGINEEMRAMWIPQSNSQTQGFGDFGRARARRKGSDLGWFPRILSTSYGRVGMDIATLASHRP